MLVLMREGDFSGENQKRQQKVLVAARRLKQSEGLSASKSREPLLRRRKAGMCSFAVRD